MYHKHIAPSFRCFYVHSIPSSSVWLCYAACCCSNIILLYALLLSRESIDVAMMAKVFSHSIHFSGTRINVEEMVDQSVRCTVIRPHATFFHRPVKNRILDGARSARCKPHKDPRAQNKRYSSVRTQSEITENGEIIAVTSRTEEYKLTNIM